MKMRQVVFGVLGLVGLVIAFVVGRYFPPAPPRSIHDKQITISSDGNGRCHVDSPVLNMSYSSDRVQWQSADDQYSITFIKIDPPVGSTPLPLGYVKETPLAPPDEPVMIDIGRPSNFYHVKQKTKYFYYGIFDQKYPSSPCKVSTDDHDPGLNVKQ
jgi:hypothetical protein